MLLFICLRKCYVKWNGIGILLNFLWVVDLIVIVVIFIIFIWFSCGYVDVYGKNVFS